MSPAGRALCFAAFVGLGLATFSAVVILPEYAALAELGSQRDALAHRLECEKKLSVYNDRLIHAIQTDPVTAARLLMRHGNFRRQGCEVVGLRSGARPPAVPDRLLREAGTAPPAADGTLCRAGRWLNDRWTSFSLLALSLGSIAAGMILFGRRA